MYHRLFPCEVRVLALKPGSTNDALSGTLQMVQFDPKTDNIPHFEALSYTWGDQTNPELITIQVDQHVTLSHPPTVGKLPVGQNLAAALRQLRDASESRLLWCDAICINQEDVAEREAQVLLMADIYKHARRVIVWLGAEADESRLAIETLQYTGLQVDYSNLYNDILTNVLSLKDDADPRFSGHAIELPYSREEWQAIANLISRSWFRRLWIRQEITLANFNALVIVGDQQIPWVLLLEAVTLIRTKLTISGVELPEPDSFRERLFNLSSFRSMRVTRDLHGAIIYTRNCQCSDNRDRVYALLGIITPELAKTIRPDYSLGVKEVYRDMVLKSVEHSQRLTILHFCDLASKPTWVPDLHQRQRFIGRFSHTFASANSDAAIRVVDKDRIMVYGVRCDDIDQRISTVPDDVTDNDLEKIVANTMIKFLGPKTDFWNQEALELAVQSLFAGQTFELTELAYYPQTARSASILKQWASSSTIDASSIVDENQTITSLRGILPGCSIYKTTSNSLVVGSSHLHPGDLVYMLLGVGSNVVLRPVSNNEFIVVGPVHHPLHAMAESICGQLPEGWRAVLQAGSQRPIFRKQNGIWQRQDPRMADVPLPAGWQEGEVAEGGKSCWYKDGRIDTPIWRDPRLRPEELTKRGIEIEDIVLQ